MPERPIVTITGAKGLIGTHLCEAFGAAGWTVRALDRSPAGEPDGTAPPLWRSVDLQAPEAALALAEAAQGAQLVIHAAFPRGSSAEGARRLSRTACAAACAAGVPLLLCSSASVYGRPNNLPCDEGEPKRPVDPYGEARWAAEVEAYSFRRTSGLKLCVLRPALTYGRGQRRGLSAALALATISARSDRSVWVLRRGPVVHAVHARDVAAAALLLARRAPEVFDGRAFNVADDAPLPLEELSRAVVAAAGGVVAGPLPYSRRGLRILSWALRGRWAARAVWEPVNRRIAAAWVRTYAGSPPSPAPRVGPELLEVLASDRYFETQRLRALGFAPSVPSPLEGLADLSLPAPLPRLEQS